VVPDVDPIVPDVDPVEPNVDPIEPVIIPDLDLKKEDDHHTDE